jgi:hypothetical protein
MTFTTFISFIVIYLGIVINLNLNVAFHQEKIFYGGDIGRHQDLFLESTLKAQTEFCTEAAHLYIELQESITLFYMFIIFMTIGMFTSSC